MASSTKPLVLMASTPVYGHIMPVRAIAKMLVARGYEVTFVSASSYQKVLEEVGCDYVPLEGYADFKDEDMAALFAERENYEPGPAQLEWDMINVFIKVIPDQHAAMQRALAKMQEKHPGRPIVQLCEGFFQGGLPIAMGARGIRPTGTAGMGIIPVCLSSKDCAPFGPGLLPDSTPEGQARNIAMTQGVYATFLKKPQEIWQEALASLGADTKDTLFFDAPYVKQDRFLQMCIPSVEYPRSDAPSTIKFTGGLPKGSRDPMANPPTWWSEVTQNPEKKDIIFVCQGTVALNYSDLTIPTMEALETRENTLVIVALGKKDGSLPEGTHVPANARVIDFLPFDEILPFTSVFVTNGGYGAFQHGLANGTPLLMAGAGEDKPEVSSRAEWAGVAVNLKTGAPTKEQIRAGVDEIISNPTYKTKAKELEAEMGEFDPLSVVIETIEELAAGK